MDCFFGEVSGMFLLTELVSEDQEIRFVINIL